ncbi:hypothetical protein P3T26_007735 [Streptomyces sp. MAA16]|nr:hypothetical protein [Streptomyces sp. MAA16]
MPGPRVEVRTVPEEIERTGDGELERLAASREANQD